MLKRIICIGLCLLFITVIMAFDASATQVKKTEQLTAQYFLRSLPAEVFDQTEWPLSENEKNYLVDVGHVNQWFIKESTPDSLLITSATPEKSELRLKVFRAVDGGGVVVVGTEGTLPCMAQFWQFDSYGSLLPLDEEPFVDVSDYFVTMSYLPPSISFSVTFCLRENDKIEAIPSFWNIAGLLEIPMEKRVFLAWNNGEFDKEIEYRSILLDTEKIEQMNDTATQPKATQRKDTQEGATMKGATPQENEPPQPVGAIGGIGGALIIGSPENQANDHDDAESDSFFLEDGQSDATEGSGSGENRTETD